jgi:hypothetical protein
MQIGGLSGFYTQNYDIGYTRVPGAQIPAAESQKQSLPGVVVEISPEGWEAYKKSQAEVSKGKEASNSLEDQKCETCENRKYVDVSNDPSVSFQSPTKINPAAAAATVAAHESEHVAHENLKAQKEDREIVKQSVTLTTAICPECHRLYVSGGVTRTTSVKESEPPTPEQ